MSRKASKPIQIDNTVKLELKETGINVKGPKGEMSIPLPPRIEVKIEGTYVTLTCKEVSDRKFLGLTWSLLNNAVTGVTKQFSKTLTIVGKGWRSTVKGDVINLQVGHSHPVNVTLPKGISATQKNPGEFTLTSHDKQLLGQVCANIKALRPVEPYKLKGIRIEGQYLRQKVRKTAAV